MSDLSPSVKKRWFFLPKLLFFCIDLILSCFEQPVKWSENDYWEFYEDFKRKYPIAFVVFLIGSLTFSIRADKFERYRSTLAICVIGYMLLGLTMLLDIQNVLKLMFYYLQYFFKAGIYPIVNALVLRKLSSNPKDGVFLYGCQRFSAPLGQLLFPPLLPGDRVYFYKQSQFFTTCIVFIILAFLCVLDQKNEDESQQDQQLENTPEATENYFIREQASMYFNRNQILLQTSTVELKSPSLFWKLLNDPKFVVLIVCLSTVGIYNSIADNIYSHLLPLLAFDSYRISAAIEARVLSNWSRCFGEILTFYFFSKLSYNFKAHQIILVAYALSILRYVVPALCLDFGIRSVSILYVTKFINGLTNGFIGLSIVRMASDMSSKTNSATFQSIFDITQSGIPIIIDFLSFSYNDPSNFPLLSVFSIAIFTFIILASIDKIFPKLPVEEKLPMKNYQYKN